MRAPDPYLVAESERAGRVDSVGDPGHRESQTGPSYVQSVLFGKRRTRGTPAALDQATTGVPQQERN